MNNQLQEFIDTNQTKVMKQTSLELLKLSFGENEQKIKDYIIDAEIDVVLVKQDPIPAEEFYHNIHKYMGESSTDTITQSEIN